MGPKPVTKARHKKHPGPQTKLFVLDTNVLLHDPTSVYRFEEHDVFLPMKTLEELDNNKKGVSDVARSARQVSRTLDEIVSSQEDGIQSGIALGELSHKMATGRLFLQTEAISNELPAGLPTAKSDNQILAVVIHLQRLNPSRQTILVSKDINMRIKARALGLEAQDYFNDKVLEDIDLLYSGVRELPEDFWDKHGQGMESWKRESRTLYRVKGPLSQKMLVNEFLYLEGPQPFYAIVREIAGKTAQFETLTDYTHPKNNVWGITARNREQNFALNLLMDPEIDFVSLLGQAGTGKTLLTLAAGLTQVLDSKRYSEIIMTRVTVPVGEDIGFLPGSEEEKMGPWMGALEDNLEVLNKSDGNEGGEWGARRHARSNPQPHKDQVAQLHARPHLPEQVPDHRRGAESHAETDEDADYARRPGYQGRLHGQHCADRHALSHGRQLGPDLRRRPPQGLAAFRARHAATRRTVASGRLRRRSVIVPL